ncbi:MAG: PD-(D/E)XK nuclease family transposase, partial [Coprobacillus sp.]
MKNHFYNSDVFFKLAFGQNNKKSYMLRRFLVEGVVGNDISVEYTCVNPEITPQIISNKKAILDIYMNMGEVEIDIEMQRSKLSPFVNRRFMHYASKLINYQLKPGQSSGSLKDLIQIIFIEDVDKRNPCLIDRYCSRNLSLNKQLGYIQTTIYIYLPYINEIANNNTLNEWEAIIYLLHNGELNNIEHEKGEMIDMLEKMYAEFNQDENLIKETSLRYYTEVDLNEWHDYDVKVAKEQGIEKG